MQLKLLIPVLIVFSVLVALSIFFMVDAFNHMRESLELQKEFKPFCGGIEIVNCTTKYFQTVIESAQQLLIAVVEILISSIFIILATYLITESIKIVMK